MLEFQNLYEDFFELEEAMDKYEFIMEYGTTASSVQEFERNSNDLIKGCTSSLWVKYSNSQFTCQADSAIVKGLGGMICDWYNQATNTQRQLFSINTLTDIGLAPLLSMGRQNGVNNLINTMKVLETGEA